MLTPASASHIRVTVKDDTLGLGARPKLLDEPTGLDAFKGLLGRLNGKSDVELEKEQRKRDDIKLARYAATKWQAVRFVRGGLLVQEKTDAATTESPENGDREPNYSEESTKEKSNGTNNDAPGPIPNKGLKIKAKEKEEKKEKKERKERKERKEKKDKKRKEKEKENSQADGKDKSQRKRDKKIKKRKHSDDSEDPDSETTTGDAVMMEANVAAIGMETSVTAPTSTSKKERVPLGRNVTRARHIAQKKRALLDDKSLNEVIETLRLHSEGSIC